MIKDAKIKEIVKNFDGKTSALLNKYLDSFTAIL